MTPGLEFSILDVPSDSDHHSEDIAVTEVALNMCFQYIITKDSEEIDYVHDQFTKANVSETIETRNVI